MSTTINQLNDDCLYLVLRECSLQELIHKQTVSARWCSLVDCVLRTKKSVAIFGSSEDAEEYDRRSRLKPSQKNSLILSQLEQFDVAILPLLMPNIQKLILNCSTTKCHLDLVSLLSQWPRFTTLTVVRCPADFIHPRYFQVRGRHHNLTIYRLQLLRPYDISPKVFRRLETLGIHWTIELL